jgi:1-deoxy-D-xylulose-5-phosphate reductoisomerase
LGIPDMKLPIQYALGFPKRLENSFNRFSFLDYPELTFEKPDFDTFKNLSLAYSAMEKGGNMPCILNAANEIMVDSFLKDKIGFLSMSDVIGNCMEKITFVKNPKLEDYINTDQETRIVANELL